MGPRRDIFGEIAAAVRKYDDMKLLATFHHARSFGYCTGAMKEKDITDEILSTWDIFDPQYRDFYWNEVTGTAREFSEQWRAKILEVIDNYRPDMIWFDGLRTSMRNDHPPESFVQEVIAHYYNSATASKQDVTVCNKHGGEFNFPESVGLRCFENGRDMPTNVGPWFLIDRAIAYPWSYVNNKKYRDGADYHIRSIIDVVSRGGIFLLSLTPKGDGSISEQEREIMHGIGRWMKVNGEAIYGSRPWKTYAEGPTVLRSMKKRNNGRVDEQWDWRKQFTSQDIRFTTKDNILYAIALEWPEDGRLTVRSLAKRFDLNIETVNLLGHEGTLRWNQTANGLEVNLPSEHPCEYAFTLKIAPKE
jgi:alpha-L-fucosidase